MEDDGIFATGRELDRISNITFKHCLSEDNAGFGFKVSIGELRDWPGLASKSLGRISFINCTARWSPNFNISVPAQGDGAAPFLHGCLPIGFYIAGLIGKPNHWGGSTIELSNITVERSPGPGLFVHEKPANSAPLLVQGARFID